MPQREVDSSCWPTSWGSMMHLARRNANALMFLHVPKTGGTSLIDNLRSCFPSDCCYSDQGNITPGLLRRHMEALGRKTFFYGHAHHGVAALAGPACLATVLRRPLDQAVSNYLHLRREPGLPLHKAALRHGLAAFMRLHWQFLVFQAISLDVALSDEPITCREMFFERLPGVHAFLDRIDHVGCLNSLDEFMTVLAAARRLPRCATVARLNTAREHGIGVREVQQLRLECQALRADPDMAPLILAEERLYGQARRIAKRQYAAGVSPFNRRIWPWSRRDHQQR